MTIQARAHVATARAPRARVNGGPVAAALSATTALLTVGSIAETAARLLAELPLADLTIEDPPIEDVISRVFEEAALEHDRGDAPHADG